MYKENYSQNNLPDINRKSYDQFVNLSHVSINPHTETQSQIDQEMKSNSCQIEDQEAIQIKNKTGRFKEDQYISIDAFVQKERQ